MNVYLDFSAFISKLTSSLASNMNAANTPIKNGRQTMTHK